MSVVKLRGRRVPAWVFLATAFVPLFLLAAWVRFTPQAHQAGGQDFRVINLFCVLWAVAFTLFHWARLDEVSREAHKFAWFWGCLAGFVLVVLALFLFAAPPAAESLMADAVGLFTAPSEPPSGSRLVSLAFVLGIGFTAAAQALGSIAVWLAWWTCRRMAR